MTIALLHRLAAEALPLILCDAQDIEAARVLVMAGHVRATFSSSERPHEKKAEKGAGTATVHALTALGRRFVQAFPPTSASRREKSAENKKPAM